MSDSVKVDSVISYILLKKLMTPFTKTAAYEADLINEDGRVIKQPETDKEKEALTLLDRVVFKIRRLLKGKMSNLHTYLWLQTRDRNQFYNKLVVRGSVEQKAEIKRIKRSLSNVAESFDCSIDDLLKTILLDEDVGE